MDETAITFKYDGDGYRPHIIDTTTVRTNMIYDAIPRDRSDDYPDADPPTIIDRDPPSE